MYKCLNCGRIIKEPKDVYELVEVGAQLLDYPVGIECPMCKGELEKRTFNDEIYDILTANFNNEIDLSDDEFDDIVETITEELPDMQPEFWEEIRYRLLELITQKLKDKLKYLRDKEKVSSLDKEEKFDLETLTMWEKGELL